MLFIQQYNPYSNNNDNDNNDSNEPFDFFSDEKQSVENEDYTLINSNKGTDTPSTIDFQPESFNQYSSFPYQQNKQKINNFKSENQSDIHDYDNYNNPRRHTHDRYSFRPQSRKDYRLFLGEKDII